MTSVRHKYHPDNNPAPGQPGHDHWGDERPADVPKSIWRAYGDRYPGSYCRRLQAEFDRNYWPGRALLARVDACREVSA